MPTPTTVQITAGGTQKAAKNTAYAALTGRLLDENGVGIFGASLTLTVDAGFGSFPGGGPTRSVQTNATGFATFPIFTANATLGDLNPRVTYPALPVAHGSWRTIDPLVPYSVSTNSGNNQSTPPNFLFANPLVARVANEINGPVAGVPVVFDAPNAGASVVWTLPATDPVTAYSDSNGLATTPTLSANATAGTYNVSATVTGIFPRQFQLTNGGAPPVSGTSALALCEV